MLSTGAPAYGDCIRLLNLCSRPLKLTEITDASRRELILIARVAPAQSNSTFGSHRASVSS
ncbi:hypothetical protein CH295_26270 [Rhodococcus sp. 14-2483-1-2]|nr:hypothetical protein CH295_26270 [Rhodococcus sp. 14-2483-1-2]